MCGLVGYVGGHGLTPSVITSMSERLRHRGPDDGGSWFDARHGLALGHRRLAIVDLSPQGHQPMVSHCERYALIFNGEIYNAGELARALGVVAWRGHSDTEVLLECIARRGVASTLRDLVGMFAFAVWDRHEATLTLARDRMGEKPLYWAKVGKALLFASELKALLPYPGFRPTISADGVAEVLRRGYIPAPATIYAEVAKLPAASWMSVRCSESGEMHFSDIERYWEVDAVRQQSEALIRIGRSDAELIDELEGAIDRSVRDQMVAEVPLGAFLSGGVDSSTVVASMQRQSSRPVRTFTIGFTEPKFNEAPFAAAVAKHLGTEHTELIVRPEDAEAVIPHLAETYDEPFADPSQVPTALVAKLTRQHVTVSLSGDGGDEWFAGYPRYMQGEALWKRLGRRPRWMRALIRNGIHCASPSAWDAVLKIIPRSSGLSGHRLHRLAEILKCDGLPAFFDAMMMQRVDVSPLMARSHRPYSGPGVSDVGEPIDVMRRVDINRYLTDDILVKVDRSTMAWSLESRAPLLDHRIAEFAWSLPSRMMQRGGEGKWILRQVLERRVPRYLTDRPKAGFALPVAEWLRGPLREWAESLLAPAVLDRGGWLNVKAVRQIWAEHLAETHDRQAQLWNILMLQAWLAQAPS